MRHESIPQDYVSCTSCPSPTPHLLVVNPVLSSNPAEGHVSTPGRKLDGTADGVR